MVQDFHLWVEQRGLGHQGKKRDTMGISAKKKKKKNETLWNIINTESFLCNALWHIVTIK